MIKLYPLYKLLSVLLLIILIIIAVNIELEKTESSINITIDENVEQIDEYFHCD